MEGSCGELVTSQFDTSNESPDYNRGEKEKTPNYGLNILAHCYLLFILMFASGAYDTSTEPHSEGVYGATPASSYTDSTITSTEFTFPEPQTEIGGNADIQQIKNNSKQHDKPRVISATGDQNNGRNNISSNPEGQDETHFNNSRDVDNSSDVEQCLFVEEGELKYAEIPSAEIWNPCFEFIRLLLGLGQANESYRGENGFTYMWYRQYQRFIATSAQPTGNSIPTTTEEPGADIETHDEEDQDEEDLAMAFITAEELSNILELNNYPLYEDRNSVIEQGNILAIAGGSEVHLRSLPESSGTSIGRVSDYMNGSTFYGEIVSNSDTGPLMFIDERGDVRVLVTVPIGSEWPEELQDAAIKVNGRPYIFAPLFNPASGAVYAELGDTLEGIANRYISIGTGIYGEVIEEQSGGTVSMTVRLDTGAEFTFYPIGPGPIIPSGTVMAYDLNGTRLILYHTTYSGPGDLGNNVIPIARIASLFFSDGVTCSEFGPVSFYGIDSSIVVLDGSCLVITSATDDLDGDGVNAKLVRRGVKGSYKAEVVPLDEITKKYPPLANFELTKNDVVMFKEGEISIFRTR